MKSIDILNFSLCLVIVTAYSYYILLCTDTYPLQKSCGTPGKCQSEDTVDTMEMMALGWEEFKLISVRGRERERQRC